MLKSKGIITPFQKQVLSVLGTIPDSSSFYLAGGMALSEFYLGHRRSYDIDFFTNVNELITPFSRLVEQGFIKTGYTVLVVRRFESFVELEIGKDNETIRLQLAYDSPFRLEQPEMSELGIKINAYTDLLADKTLTFFGRWKHRDAIDLYLFIQKEPLSRLFDLAKQKDPGFDLYWFAAALLEVSKFPDDIKEWPVEMLVPINAKELKKQFLAIAVELTKQIKGDNKNGHF